MATIQGVATARAIVRVQHAQQMRAASAAHGSTNPITTSVTVHQGQQLAAPKVLLSRKVRIAVYGLQLIQVLITGALMVGVSGFFLRIARGSEARATMVFAGFQNFGRALCAYFLMMLFILLWTLLLLVTVIYVNQEMVLSARPA